MEAGFIRERYKIVHTLDSAPDYVCLEAINILDREKRSCLLNVYEGDLRREYLPYYDQLQSLPSFLEAFLDGDRLVIAFELCAGQTIDQMFYRGASHAWQTRLAYADLLFEKALSLADAPPAIGCAAMLSENLFFDADPAQVRLRFKLLPMEGMNPRELVLLTSDQAKKILLRRFASPGAELDFLTLLDRGEAENIVSLYGLWRVWRERIRESYEALEEKSFIRRGLALGWGHLGRWQQRQYRGR